MKRRLLITILVIFLISCSESPEEIQQKEEEQKEAKYGQAVMELAKENTTTSTKIDKRYKSLEGQIDKILEGEEELKMAQFTRIKIELDYLQMVNYTPKKVALISNKFKKAFAAAEAEVKEEDYSGVSLGDRFYSLERKIEKISSGEIELTVTEYLQVEKGLNDLDADGYVLPAKVTELRKQLVQAVMKQLESAIFDYEPVIEEEPEPEAKIEDLIPKVPEEEEEVIEEEEPEEKIDLLEHVVLLIEGGFNVENLYIDVNDTVIWENIREGRYPMALILGNNKCRAVKSKMFYSGESYNYTFTEPMTCWVSDGIFTTQAMKIEVS